MRLCVFGLLRAAAILKSTFKASSPRAIPTMRQWMRRLLVLLSLPLRFNFLACRGLVFTASLSSVGNEN